MTQEAKFLIGIGVVTVAMLGAALFFLGKAPSPQTNNSKVDASLLVREDSQKISTDSAKVTIVEFSDFQCPACAVGHQVMKRILEDYKGKINFVYRHFPLPQHPFGTKAALAAEAAGEQGNFWGMYDKLFENQEKWSTSANPVDDFVNYAKELGLDGEKVKQEIESNKFADKIKKDQNDGISLGVNSTPTFYINGEKLEGGASYDNFKTKIDADLQK